MSQSSKILTFVITKLSLKNVLSLRQNIQRDLIYFFLVLKIITKNDLRLDPDRFKLTAGGETGVYERRGGQSGTQAETETSARGVPTQAFDEAERDRLAKSIYISKCRYKLLPTILMYDYLNSLYA